MEDGEETIRLDGSDKQEDTEDIQTDTDSVPDGGLRAWLVVLGGTALSMSTFGYVISWGTFQAYYELTLLRDHSSSAIAWIGSAQYSLVYLLGFISGRLFDLGYFKPSLLASCTVMTVANFLTAECTLYWQFLLCQGILFGLAAGCIYIPCISVMSHWFKNKRPLAFSIVAISSSIGGILYPVIFRLALPAVGFAWSIRIIAFVNLFTFIIACVTMRTRLPRKQNIPSMFDMHAFRSPAYRAYTLSTLIAFLGLYTPLTFMAVSAADINIDPSFIFYIIAIVNAASAIGRILGGVLALKHGSLNMLTLFTFLSAIFVFTWPLPRSLGAFLAVAILYGITSGVFIGLFPVPVVQLGDMASIGRWTGMQMSIMAIGALAGPPISGAIRLKHSNFTLVGVYAGIMVVTSVALMLLTKRLAVGRLLGEKF